MGVRDGEGGGGGRGRWGVGGGEELGSTAPESGLPTSLRPVTAIQVIGYTIPPPPPPFLFVFCLFCWCSNGSEFESNS